MVAPLNDTACLDLVINKTRAWSRTSFAQQQALLFASTAQLADWIQSEPQLDDDGRAPRKLTLPCDYPVRLREDPRNPNCVERAALYLMLAEVIDPSVTRSLITVSLNKSDGSTVRHTNAMELVDGAWTPVMLQPTKSPLPSVSDLQRRARNGFLQDCVVAPGADPRNDDLADFQADLQNADIEAVSDLYGKDAGNAYGSAIASIELAPGPPKGPYAPDPKTGRMKRKQPKTAPAPRNDDGDGSADVNTASSIGAGTGGVVGDVLAALPAGINAAEGKPVDQTTLERDGTAFGIDLGLAVASEGSAGILGGPGSTVAGLAFGSATSTPATSTAPTTPATSSTAAPSNPSPGRRVKRKQPRPASSPRNDDGDDDVSADAGASDAGDDGSADVNTGYPTDDGSADVNTGYPTDDGSADVNTAPPNDNNSNAGANTGSAGNHGGSTKANAGSGSSSAKDLLGALPAALAAAQAIGSATSKPATSTNPAQQNAAHAAIVAAMKPSSKKRKRKSPAPSQA